MNISKQIYFKYILMILEFIYRYNLYRSRRLLNYSSNIVMLGLGASLEVKRSRLRTNESNSTFHRNSKFMDALSQEVKIVKTKIYILSPHSGTIHRGPSLETGP